MLTETGDITHWIAFSAGLLSFFSPCVLPLIPSFMAYITGVSFADLKQEHQSSKVRWRVLSHSLAIRVRIFHRLYCAGGRSRSVVRISTDCAGSGAVVGTTHRRDSGVWLWSAYDRNSAHWHADAG